MIANYKFILFVFVFERIALAIDVDVAISLFGEANNQACFSVLQACSTVDSEKDERDEMRRRISILRHQMHIII